MRSIREDLKDFIVEKVKSSVSPDRPYMFVRWSGLYELCKAYHLDLLELVDELCREKRLRKALIKGKLALTLPNMAISKKAREIVEEFQKFIEKD
jgi:hypothetical protein